MAAKAFIEQYLECTDSLPLDIQRVISQYWELDNKTKDLLSEAQCVRAKSEAVISGGSVATCSERQNWLIKLQRVMLALREVGNEKVELTSQMLDLVEEYSQQLLLTEKEMDNCRTRDELTGTRSSSVAHIYKNSTSVSGLGEFNEVRKKGERHQKRSRNAAHEHNEEELSPFSMTPPIKDNNKKKDVVVPMPAPNTIPSIKPPKKKMKVKKKTTTTSTKESQPLPLIPPGVVIPQPDFTSEPIDPDEPTYCLCNQVSFGEMIGCDNEECQIEWFHFQCVGLTSKPKGKWFCPRCQPERIKHNRSSK